MAVQTNITTEQEQIELRDIRRNSNNQIVSYTLDGDSDKQYGYKKVKGVRTLYQEDVYDRTLPRISDELFVNIPDIGLEILEQKFIDEEDIYIQTGNRLVSIKDTTGEVEPEDIFSGRYELTPSAPSFRTDRGGADNSHYMGVGYYDQAVSNETRGYIKFPGFKEVSFDKAVFGPPLEDGGYRITQELIDSGRDLQLQGRVGFKIPSGREAKMRFCRKNTSLWPGLTDYEEITISAGGSDYYPIRQINFRIPNADLRLHDIWELQTEASWSNGQFFIYGDKSSFRVTAILPDEPPIIVPADIDDNPPLSYTNPGNQSEADEGQTAPRA